MRRGRDVVVTPAAAVDEEEEAGWEWVLRPPSPPGVDADPGADADADAGGAWGLALLVECAVRSVCMGAAPDADADADAEAGVAPPVCWFPEEPLARFATLLAVGRCRRANAAGSLARPGVVAEAAPPPPPPPPLPVSHPAAAAAAAFSCNTDTAGPSARPAPLDEKLHRGRVSAEDVAAGCCRDDPDVRARGGRCVCGREPASLLTPLPLPLPPALLRPCMSPRLVVVLLLSPAPAPAPALAPALAPTPAPWLVEVEVSPPARLRRLPVDAAAGNSRFAT